jgi:metal-responsive CopG/Arc/MetJ family transcriptional regulator
MHIHINEIDCMEVIGVQGKALDIKRLSDELATIRG